MFFTSIYSNVSHVLYENVEVKLIFKLLNVSHEWQIVVQFFGGKCAVDCRNFTDFNSKWDRLLFT